LKKENSEKIFDLLIIGGGPAGLTAAAYAIRKRIETILISQDLGGKTNYKFSLEGVETHFIIDGEELVSKFKSQLEYLEFARHLEIVTQFDKKGGIFEATTKSGRVFKARAAIIATGVMPRRLKVPGDERLIGRGVSYSAVSHAPLFVNMDVAVVGENAQALQAAAELARTSKKVYLIGVPAEYLHSKLGETLQRSGNVEFLSDYEVKDILGNTHVERILVSSKVHRTEKEIAVRGVFVNLGLVASSELFSHLVKTTPEGRIMIDAKNETGVPGLFAAGDVTDAYSEQVVIAIGEGANAALSAYDYLLTAKS
jgi:alkyl hydroperoxide reductase subunit F